jgi:hypothetical protein
MERDRALDLQFGIRIVGIQAVVFSGRILVRSVTIEGGATQRVSAPFSRGSGLRYIFVAASSVCQ